MSNAEARAWWSDVQHLRDEDPSPAPSVTLQEPPTDELPVAEPRNGRITGRPLRRREGEHAPSRAAEPRLARADAADFAAALDLDGAFGTPRRASKRAESREIVLTRDAAFERARERAERDAAPRRRPLAVVPEPAERPAVDREAARRTAEHEALLAPRDRFERGPDGRRTVQISGQPAAAPRTRLRELERRRPNRRPVDRIASRPDRIALWVVILGILLVVIAATSSSAQAATLGF
jgi:hypothetical protein